MGDATTTTTAPAFSANDAERFVRAQLNPPAGEAHKSPLWKKKQEFLDNLDRELLATGAYNDDKTREKKLNEAANSFDNEIVRRAKEGAAVGGSPEEYRVVDPEERRQKETSSGLIRGLIGAVAGFFGGIFSFLWDLLKQLPGVGDFISGIGDKRTPDEKAKETMAAGVVGKLSVPIELEGQTVVFSSEEQQKIFRNMQQFDYRAEPTITKASTATKIASLVSRGQGAAHGLTSDTTFNRPNGIEPPPPVAPVVPAAESKTR